VSGPTEEYWDARTTTPPEVKAKQALRDTFAGLAMQGIVSALAKGIRPDDIEHLGADAYRIADAMLKARSAS
jgi:hypothetical protein